MIGLFQSHPIIDPARIRGKRLSRILVSDWLIHYHKRLFRRPLTRPGKYLTRLGKYCAVIGRKPVLKPVWLWINLFLTTTATSRGLRGGIRINPIKIRNQYQDPTLRYAWILYQNGPPKSPLKSCRLGCCSSRQSIQWRYDTTPWHDPVSKQPLQTTSLQRPVNQDVRCLAGGFLRNYWSCSIFVLTRTELKSESINPNNE